MMLHSSCLAARDAHDCKPLPSPIRRKITTMTARAPVHSATSGHSDEPPDPRIPKGDLVVASIHNIEDLCTPISWKLGQPPLGLPDFWAPIEIAVAPHLDHVLEARIPEGDSAVASIDHLEFFSTPTFRKAGCVPPGTLDHLAAAHLHKVTVSLAPQGHNSTNFQR